MTSNDEPELARVVITGVNEHGKSVASFDGPTKTWTRRPTGTLVMELWREDELPISVDSESSLGSEVILAPPANGVVVRTTIFPPDSSISEEAAAAFAAAMEDIYGPGNEAGGAVPGMHTTETIDVMTVIDGEIWAVLEEGEVVLRAGDSMVQRGTRHAWQNRSDRPTTVVTTMMPAHRNR
ncbi:cupin domain-containing protein [Rhodococcus sp. 06-156-3C]|uniref:cupin domain-containing protein n=1 Tax=Nocardiaceae TaxID=85025 RepID=UPI000522E921|nr:MULTISPECIES: cupin domain-containing protein [Rhodococcus]OZD11638.1 cupin domain-containing protein [Rhodococcus sp. 06-156-4C]OZD15480.1 cupin domain-containing protein [Rhodococcus sp. 06-156-4a]OZD23646.1 cupin domain-containing protein [Rhodococcus sp. 06-156-3C]OZD27282.1 cupin domain-containing protein [Rhodococcus sp. 06-156-3b]OZD31322.1 cupin domain-containing protein [Rhodococcus sp. 06-156-3]